MVVEKEGEIKETYSESLQCPYCDHRFLCHNCLRISSQQDACSHLIVFDPVFSTRVRISKAKFEVSEEIDFEEILDQLFGELTVVRDSDPRERQDDDCWIAVYHRRPDDVLSLLSELFNQQDC